MGLLRDYEPSDGPSFVSSFNEDTTNNNTRDLDWRLLGDEASKSALNRKTDSLKNKIKGFRLIWTKTLLVVDSLLDIQNFSFHSKLSPIIELSDKIVDICEIK